MKGFAPPSRFGGAQIPQEPLPITRTITVTEGISVKDLAEKLGVRGKDLIATLLMRGVFVTVNQSLDAELVKDVARQFGADTSIISFEDEMANEALETLLGQEHVGEIEVVRPPVVTVMGHVDHGKTSLLDAIRETDVAAGEAGGITQHIGAYKVRIAKQDSPAFGREIVFLDTPGHEAFTRMRARGAKVTDIVVIVVAADDGVMPQTLEAVDHAKAANVPIIVAVNKIDKPEAQPDRVKQQLGDRGLVPEAWGGSTVFVDVSAKKRMNLDLLLEMICLTADLGDLKATPDRSGVGTVLEAKLDRGRGAVASVLVQNGTLRNGESFIVGNTFGKVRAMFDDRGRAIEEAGPSTPVEILGLEGMPDAGDNFLVVADRDKAKGIAQYRKMKERESQLAKSSRVSLEGLAEQIKQAGVKDLPLILKGDVQGSVQVLSDSLSKMSTEKVRIKILHSGVGAITESDILLASASNAIVIGFNVQAGAQGCRTGRAGRRRDPAALDHLRAAGRDHQGDAGTARSSLQGELPGPRVGAGSLPHPQGGHHRWLPRHRRLHSSRRRSARDAWRRAGLQGQARIAQALQGRCARSHQRHGVRHGNRQLQRRAAGRSDRGLRYREDGCRADGSLNVAAIRTKPGHRPGFCLMQTSRAISPVTEASGCHPANPACRSPAPAADTFHRRDS